MTDETDERAANATESNATRSGAAQSIREVIERTFLAGMGAAALTKDKLQDLSDELVRLGQLNAEEGRDMIERLLARTREDARSVLKKADLPSLSAYRDLAATLQQQINDQEFRLRQLEHRVQLLESAVDRTSQQPAE